jgi:hypothetical protein
VPQAPSPKPHTPSPETPNRKLKPQTTKPKTHKKTEKEAAAARSAASELIGSSKDTLPALETAALLISLDECTSNDKSEQAGSAVMGDAGSPGSGGSGRWFERAFTLVVGRDCAASLSCVETLAELSCTCQMWEYALASEAYPLSGERWAYPQ